MKYNTGQYNTIKFNTIQQNECNIMSKIKYTTIKLIQEEVYSHRGKIITFTWFYL